MTPPPAEPGIALHHQIMSVLRGAMAGGRYRPGELLPSEQALMDSFKVSRGTVRRALLALDQQGLVERMQGRGARVLSAPPVEPRQLHGMIDDPSAMPEGLSMRLISVERGPDAVRIQRLRLRGDMPFWLTTATLPAAIGRRFSDDDLGSQGFVALFERIGRPAVRTREDIGAVSADPQLASLLGVVPGTALIDYRRVFEDADGEELCSHINLIRPDRHRIRLSLVADEKEPADDV